MKKYHVYDEISGDYRDVFTETPLEAVIKYLKKDTEPNPNIGEWQWNITVTRAVRIPDED